VIMLIVGHQFDVQEDVFIDETCHLRTTFRNTKNFLQAISTQPGELDVPVDIYIPFLITYATDVISESTYGPHGSTNTLPQICCHYQISIDSRFWTV
jgi:hypothetical protein